MGDSLDQEFTNLIADANLDPRPIYARLRDEAPVYRTPLDFWYVTSYEAAKEVARDAGAFSSDPNNGAGAVDTSGRPATMPDSPAIQLLRRLVLFVDPPDHTRLRKLVSRVFTANRTLTRRGFIDEVIQKELDGIAGRRQVEFVRDFALEFPTRVILTLVGIDPALAHHFIEGAESMIMLNDAGKRTEERVEAAAKLEATANLVAQLADEVSAKPHDDTLFKLLTEANEEGDKLTRDEVVAMVLLLVVAGHETTAYTLSSSMYHLLNNPQELDLLRTDPSVYPTAIEELLRYDAAARHTVARWAIQDVVLGDVTIRKGETVFGSLQAADHDPAVFDNPLKLDLRRHPNPHIAFGWGAHLCVGAPLARLELELALRAILDRTTMVALASDGVEWRDSFTIRGPRRLPLEWDLE